MSPPKQSIPAKTCPHCAVEFVPRRAYRGTYCSVSCGAAAGHRIKNGGQPGGDITECKTQIPLKPSGYALIDHEFYDEFRKWTWRISEFGYARRAVWDKTENKSKSIYMHRFVANAPEGLQVDHINGNKLDNRKSNLRWASASDNICNRSRMITNKSGYKGVWQEKKHGRWISQITRGGVVRSLGSFPDPQSAHAAYCAAAAKFHGEFARVA